MKKVILMAACLFSLSTVVNAQEVPAKTEHKGGAKHHEKLTPEQRAQKSVDQIHSIVVLTDDQKTKVYDLALTRVKNIDAIKVKYKGQEDKKEVEKTEIKAIRKTFHQSVKGLLTPEQIAKAKAAKDAKGEQEKNHNEAFEGKD